MTDKIFVDSNIWLYLFLQDSEKKYKLAEDFFIRKSFNSLFVITYHGHLV